MRHQTQSPVSSADSAPDDETLGEIEGSADAALLRAGPPEATRWSIEILIGFAREMPTDDPYLRGYARGFDGTR